MNIYKNLYDYQKDVVMSTFSNNKGVVVLPTGTGKTYCQAAIIANDILMNKDQFRMYVINAPRILLSYQLQKEIYYFLVSNGIEARYHMVHSGTSVDESDLEQIRIEATLDGNEIPFSEIESSTSLDKAVEAMNKAKEQNLPIVIFSTYNSAEKVEYARRQINHPISIVMNDEAHYLVQERFYDILDTLKSSRCYFFTATAKNTPSNLGRGMNNVESYGEVLYSMVPREAIDRGKMVRPRVHTIKTNGVFSSDDYDKSINKVILDSFYEHKKQLEDNHPNMKPKVLVSTRGSYDMKNFLISPQYAELRNAGVDIFIVASTEIGNDVNGTKVKRQDFLRDLREFGKDETKMLLVLHYDILTEGIDVPGFTAIMPLRTLSKSSFCQLYGRAARLHTLDRQRLFSEEISPNDLDKMTKPYAYIILPFITSSNKDDSEHMRQIVTELREYGFNPTEDVIGDFSATGIDEEEGPEGFNYPGTRNRTTLDIISEVYSEFELEEVASLSPMDYFDQFINN
jgi:superfamily II DNA or RNA helicase